MLVDFLNQTVGAGEVGDGAHRRPRDAHDPAVSGAFMIDIDRLTRDLEQTFDTDGDDVPLFTKIRPTEIWVNDAAARGQRGTR